MKAVEKVLPSSPQFKEQVLAKDQPEYLPLPCALIEYSDGVKSLISRYKLTWKERITIFFKGNLWIEQLTGSTYGLQPQKPTVTEPVFTERCSLYFASDNTICDKPKGHDKGIHEFRVKLSAKERFDNIGKQFKQAYKKA